MRKKQESEFFTDSCFCLYRMQEGALFSELRIWETHETPCGKWIQTEKLKKERTNIRKKLVMTKCLW